MGLVRAKYNYFAWINYWIRRSIEVSGDGELLLEQESNARSRSSGGYPEVVAPAAEGAAVAELGERTWR